MVSQSDCSFDFLKKLKEENEELKGRIQQLEQIIDQKNRDLLEQLDNEEETLRHYRSAIYQNCQLESKYFDLEYKYNLIRNAKLAKLTIKYWKYRKRVPENF
ncbi:hypothetical protein M5W83_07100 [Paenibacillus thiaminolyticus]|uniref:Uncharacterized protein n=1 Tax=Paenibacillus thiaminolyticus TaxID=49283 RepID=A0AAP9DUA5_PANTH|nr:hypothetical protein [Paenibacillus thiaminolyticus]MCY9537771.1 hypothetical protein [Paenibacillus thiaminolyticus]MCY9604040.1 hypothetical protein [Paenibacillus thiaminolyticus]MCY9606915.1 hypothetical protein [Paenibacillus thiaminolyticus]MCY9616266.1 hypothetical protein [Paenibacillus thiaminolyticus]MCY9619361.1 hypothetical protein [Paenibacillus thiaminolyticus]